LPSRLFIHIYTANKPEKNKPRDKTLSLTTASVIKKKKFCHSATSTAVSNGVVKMNIDTDTQWAYWDGLRLFYQKNEAYLQGQVANSIKLLLVTDKDPK
jgi:fructose/tagatose bisphosphate aldolase